MTRHAKASSAGSTRGARARAAFSPLRAALSVGLGLVLCAALFASPAFAVETHPYTGVSFGPDGTSGSSFGQIQSIAVDPESKDIYVYDGGGSGSIYKFNAAHEPVKFSALSGNKIENVGSAGGAENQVAIAPPGSPGGTAGDIYAANNSVIKIYAPSGEPIGELTGGETCGVATDPAGHVFAGVYREEVREYVPAANPAVNTDQKNVSNGKADQVCNVSVDGLGNVYASAFNGSVIVKLAGIGDPSGTRIEPGAPTTGIDPASNDLYADRGEVVAQYSPSGTLVSTFGGGQLANSRGVAVNGTTGNVYVGNGANGKVDVFGPIVLLPDAETKAATDVSSSGATLGATINPEGVELDECFFEFGDEGELDQTQPCAETPAQIGSGEAPVPVHADLTGLSASTPYGFRVAASNSFGETKGEVKSFETTGPAITDQAVSKVTFNSATITALINPHGQATDFQLEYVSQADFEASGYAKATKAPAAPVEVGSGPGPVEVTQEITGLSGATAYQVRVVASNASATVQGPDVQFTTYPAPAGLPEGRAYEMVSPAVKIGEVFPPEPGESLGGSHSCGFDYCQPGLVNPMMPIQTDPAGEAISFVGQPFSEAQAPSSNQYISRRSADSWSTQDITPLRAEKNSGFQALAPDLSVGVLAQGSPALSPGAPTGEDRAFENLYLWEEGNPSLRPLVTVEPPQRSASFKNTFRLSFRGYNSGTTGSPDFDHIVFEANDALTPAVPDIAPPAPEIPPAGIFDPVPCEGVPGDEIPGDDCNLYEWVNGQLRLVNVLPGNNAAASEAVIGSGKGLADHVRPEAADVDHAISADGSRIFWSDSSGQVYVRIDGKETVKLKDPGQFITATPDGSKVMLKDGCIYLLASESCEATLGSGDASKFIGILGASEDLSRVYFVDTEALAPGAQAESCEQGQGEGEGKVPPGHGCNVYVFDKGNVIFVTTLVRVDNEIEHYGDWRFSPSNRTAQVSPDGRYLTFMSYAKLGDYDNRLAADSCYGSIGSACSEVYQYDLTSQSLSCASCNPTGQRPLGGSTLSLTNSVRAPFPQLRNLSSEGEGQVFFDSTDVLSGADHNGRIQDVYEWQPNGVGGCARAKGCVSLISAGNNSSDSFFLNSTSSGRDVLFVTRSQLLSRDKDDLFDVYDARVGGGFNENIPPPCLGEACKGAATSAPEQQSAGSAQFSGPGNEKPHKRKPHKHKKKSKKHKHTSKKKAHKRAAKSNRGGQK